MKHMKRRKVSIENYSEDITIEMIKEYEDYFKVEYPKDKITLC